MKIPFTKMHGAGNDYIYINCFDGIDFSPPALAKLMSPRRFSVGADGVILICASDIADAKMRIFNLDGSEGKMCGNGIRCVGKYLYEKGIVKKKSLAVETMSGVKKLSLDVACGTVRRVSVDMGKAELRADKIPVLSLSDTVIGAPLEIDGQTYVLTCVSMGNPHAVTFVKNAGELDVIKAGAAIARCGLFPEGVNVEFAEAAGKNELFCRVFERGSGETLSCGTGACAAAVAGVLDGRCDTDAPITVRLRGGELYVTVTRELYVTLSGGAETVYEGVYEYEGADK